MSRAIRLEIAQTRRAERVAHPGGHRHAMGPGHTPELTELGLVKRSVLTTQRKPMCAMPLSIIRGCRAAGR